MAIDFASKIKPTENYIVVDGACDQTTGICEYKGVMDVEIFRVGPLRGGTNNIAELTKEIERLKADKSSLMKQLSQFLGNS